MNIKFYLKNITKSVLLTENLVSKLVENEPRTGSKPTVTIDGINYYFMGNLVSTRPRSKFEPVTPDFLLELINKLDPDAKTTYNCVESEVSALLSQNNIKPADAQTFIELFSEILDKRHHDGDFTVKLPYISALNPLNQTINELFLKTHEVGLQTFTIGYSDAVSLALHGGGGVMTFEVIDELNPNVIIRMQPRCGAEIIFTESLPSTMEPLLSSTGADPKRKTFENEIVRAVKILLSLSNNAKGLGSRLTKKMTTAQHTLADGFKATESVALTTPNPTPPTYFIIGDYIYSSEVTLMEYYSKSGVPLTLKNLEVCNDARVFVSDDVSPTAIKMISSIAQTVEKIM